MLASGRHRRLSRNSTMTASTNGSASNGAAADSAVSDHLLEGLREDMRNPDTLRLLRAVLKRLDVIHLAVESADGLLRRADTLTENVAGSVAELRGVADGEMIVALASLANRTPELVETLDALQPALESDAFKQLVRPEVLESLAKLTEHSDLLLFAAETAKGFLERAESIADNAAGGVNELRSILGDNPKGLILTMTHLGSLLPGLQSALAAFVKLNDAGAIEALLSSNVLAPEVVRIVGNMGDALHATHSHESVSPTRMGIFGLMKSMRDPDVQRALGFFQRFLKEFGSRLPGA